MNLKFLFLTITFFIFLTAGFDLTFLVAGFFSLADLVYSSFLSSLDYLGEINWDSITFTKKWYAQIKSRPSFRDLLEEKIYEVPPSRHYSDLDF